MLVDRLDYWLNSEYTSWITDPEDPDVKRRRAEQKRAGVKPPPQPVITPVAKRPPAVIRELAKALQEKVKEVGPEAEQKPSSSGRRYGTVKDLRRILGKE